jgi:hypothetical protein
MPKLYDDLKEEIFKSGDKITVSLNKSKRIVGHFPELGLCNRCNNLKGVVTEFGAKRATCYSGVADLTGKHKVKECTSFWDRTYIGIQSLLDMGPIMIDVKETIGF